MDVLEDVQLLRSADELGAIPFMLTFGLPHDSGSDWYEVDDFPYEGYEEYYAGPDYDSDWGGSDFKDSQYWEEFESDSSIGSSDYDFWDSSDTDWDSDW